MRVETLAVHEGNLLDSAHGAVQQPITLSVTYERDAACDHQSRYYYTGKGNPNRDSLESAFARLEGGATAVAFASGSAATTAVFRTLRPGDHVLIPQDVFQGTVRVLRDVLSKWNVTYSTVDMTSKQAVLSAVRNSTRMIWMETLSNPLLQVTDVKAIVSIAREAGATSVVDNTFVTPVLQRPLDDGADLVVHSTTKYIGGHGDVLGGMVVARHATPTIEEIRKIQVLEGAVPSPFDCWLVRRGIKTLAYRIRGHCENALNVAQALEAHPMIQRVHYPGLPSHPQHALAKRQLIGGFGGIVAIEVLGDVKFAIEVCSRVKLFTQATSFGEAESLIQHQASSPTQGTGTGIAENLLRLSIGLEHPQDLIEDLEQALRAAQDSLVA